MSKTVAIVQSCYIPWKGYFDMINMVDEFILFDVVQYTRRDWRNRNKIKTPAGSVWLTIPVNVKGKFFQSIQETTVSSPGWAAEHWKTLCQWYAKAPCFGLYREPFEALYLGCRETYLSKINERFLRAVCGMLGISTILTSGEHYEIVEGKNERLIHLCKQAGATTYLSGRAAENYIDQEMFAREGITVQWMEYSGYPEYRQLFPPFEHTVSILDLLFNEGPEATRFMRSFNR